MAEVEWFLATVLLLRGTCLLVRLCTKGNCFCCNIVYVALYYSNLNCMTMQVQPKTNRVAMNLYKLIVGVMDCGLAVVQCK
jgi:hypothetical protein